MATVELPSGHTADILDTDELTAGVKLAVQRSIQMVVKDKQVVMSLALSEEMKIATLVKVIKSWTHEKLPTAQAIEELSIRDYNALTEAIKEHMKLLSASPDKSGSKED
jgi:hypothetical protein